MYGFTSTYPTLGKSRLIKTLRRQKLFFQTYTYFIYEPDIIVLKWLRNRTGNISISQKWFVIIWRKIYIFFFSPWNTADIDKTSRFDKLWKIKTITKSNLRNTNSSLTKCSFKRNDPFALGLKGRQENARVTTFMVQENIRSPWFYLLRFWTKPWSRR